MACKKGTLRAISHHTYTNETLHFADQLKTWIQTNWHITWYYQLLDRAAILSKVASKSSKRHPSWHIIPHITDQTLFLSPKISFSSWSMMEDRNFISNTPSLMSWGWWKFLLKNEKSKTSIFEKLYLETEEETKKFLWVLYSYCCKDSWSEISGPDIH